MSFYQKEKKTWADYAIPWHHSMIWYVTYLLMINRVTMKLFSDWIVYILVLVMIYVRFIFVAVKKHLV